MRVGASAAAGMWLATAIALAQAPDGGLPRRPALGIALGPADGGAVVTAVLPGSAAETGGLKPGDVIRTIDGSPVLAPADLIAAVARHRAGETVQLEIARAGTPAPQAVRLGSLQRETMPGVTFEYDAVALADGTRLRTIVTVPEGERSRVPAVLLVPGGGCGSVDVPAAPDVAQPGLMRTLAARGYVTMRVEKSGVGDSTGPACDTIGYFQELDGYRAALAALKQHPAVDAERVILLGISLGGVFAPVLANESSVRGIVVYGTLGSAPSPYPGRSERFFREFATADIKGAWTAVTARVLVLHGQFDENEAVVDHTQIAPWVNARHPGNATHVVFDGLDHCWTRHPSMEAARGHCGGGQPDTTLQEAIVQFVRRVTDDPRPKA